VARPDRRDVDDTAAARARQQRPGGARAPQRTLDVGGEGLVEVLLGDVVEADEGAGRCVVHQDVQPPVRPPHLLEHPLDLRGLGDRGTDDLGVAARGDQFGGQRLRRVVGVEAVDQHGRPRVGEHAHDTLADTARATGDQGDLPVQRTGHRRTPLTAGSEPATKSMTLPKVR
jgi:hypothetical protein